MTQNIYDDEQFFSAYSTLPRSVEGLDRAVEWPEVRRLLPDLTGTRIVDLGCGFGWFCRWAVAHGAASVLGIDVSARMLDRATADTDDRRIIYQRQDLEQLTLPKGSFDLAFSSLTLHYLVDLPHVLRTVAQALAPRGDLVVTIEHPVFTAPTRAEFVGVGDSATWPLDGYFDEGPRVTDWLTPGVIKQHRTITSYVTELRRAGLAITDIVEWEPTAQQLRSDPSFAMEAQRPLFLLLSARATMST
jgi:SAM-dependent methyltransferase